MIVFTEEIKTYISENYKGISNSELADRINKKFGTDMTAQQVNNYKSRKHLNSGLTGRYEKGHIPYNKGKKMSPDVYAKAEPTMFKKGRVSHNIRPVGSERVTVDGYIEVKVANPNKWELKHKLVWEKANGKVPEKHAIIFLDGNSQNVELSNLKLVSRKELLIMNRQKLFGATSELTEAGINIAKLYDAKYKAEKRNTRDS